MSPPAMSPAAAAAFLGPHGSYSHQAALALLPATARLVPHRSIAAAYAAPHAAAAVLPLENTIHGVVQETLACLLSDGDGPARWAIAGTYDKQVQHCLVVPRACTDDELSDVKWVASHEQALGQCAHFIRTHLPNAQLLPYPSTAQAARALATITARNTHAGAGVNGNHDGNRGGNDDRNGNSDGDITLLPRELRASLGAAICSEVAADGLPGVRVARKGVQDVAANYTRFLLLQRRPPPASGTSSERLHPTPTPLPLPTTLPTGTRFFRLENAQLLPLLLAHPQVRGLVAVHSRANPHTCSGKHGDTRGTGTGAGAGAGTGDHGDTRGDTTDGVQRDTDTEDDGGLQRLYDDKYRKRYLVEVEVRDEESGQEAWPRGVIPL